MKNTPESLTLEEWGEIIKEGGWLPPNLCCSVNRLGDTPYCVECLSKAIEQLVARAKQV